jgi:hypothetical protein
MIHEYFGVDVEIVWKTTKEDIPPRYDRRPKIRASAWQSVISFLGKPCGNPPITPVFCPQSKNKLFIHFQPGRGIT